MKKKIISETPIFKELNNEQLQKISDIALLKQVEKNEIIFSEGEEGIGFYIVASGMIKIYKSSISGKEQILHIFEKGEPFGEAAVFMNRPFPATAMAIKKGSVLFFPKKKFINLAQKDTMFVLKMLAVLSVRLKQLASMVENISLKDVPGRLAEYLLYMNKEQNNNNIISLNISKSQLAAILGTISETLSRIFSKMSLEKILEVNGNNIRILDLQKLQELSENGSF
ncbi:MAG: Crp/Fnr family transcriptional regulator [Deltaproteobacteria bacterium]|nr:Crp/Fnr family transcriptional regulator [Deltaproteobacteria bacterium]